MTATINASTTAGVVITPDNSGSIALQAAGTTVATFNSTGVNAGIQVASNAAPAFYAYQSSSQTISAGTNTKVNLQTELFDTNSNFASSRFTPTVAGYYQIGGGVYFNTVGSTTFCSFWKNSSILTRGTQGALNESTGTTLVYLNGSTDYMELYAYNQSSASLDADYPTTFMWGCMVRSA